nr:UPF0175 family protein [Aphanothece hegewaldii]
MSPAQLSVEVRLAEAVKLYELGQLSSGAAANLVCIPKVVFLAKLSDYGVDSFQLTEEELIEDLRSA